MAVPTTAIVTKVTGERTMSPPAIAQPYSLQAESIPSYRAFTSSTSVWGLSPRVTRACRGSPPMAAMSLRLTARAFQPKSRHDTLSCRKWTPSTIVSVVVSSVESRLSQAAASSPMPSVMGEGRSWAHTISWRTRISSNSPISETFTCGIISFPNPGYKASVL